MAEVCRGYVGFGDLFVALPALHPRPDYAYWYWYLPRWIHLR